MPVVLIVLLILGAVGLFLALPGGRTTINRVGLVLLAGAGGALCAASASLAGGQQPVGWFLACALVGLFAAVRVVTHKKPVYSALYFVLLALAVTGLLIQMQAEFLAAALVIVYAGAILVTYMFVIMLAQQGGAAAYDSSAREPFWGCLAGFTLLAVIGTRLFTDAEPVSDLATAVPEATGTVEVVGARLLTHYVVAIQIIGVLLLAAMVGAIAIARRRPATDTPYGEGQ